MTSHLLSLWYITIVSRTDVTDIEFKVTHSVWLTMVIYSQTTALQPVNWNFFPASFHRPAMTPGQFYHCVWTGAFLTLAMRHLVIYSWEIRSKIGIHWEYGNFTIIDIYYIADCWVVFMVILVKKKLELLLLNYIVHVHVHFSCMLIRSRSALGLLVIRTLARAQSSILCVQRKSVTLHQLPERQRWLFDPDAVLHHFCLCISLKLSLGFWLIVWVTVTMCGSTRQPTV